MLKRRPVLFFYLVVFALAILGAWLAFFVFRGSIWIEWIAACTPAVAAVALTALLDGKPGVAALLARLLRWRVHWKWYLAVFLLSILFDLVYVLLSAVYQGRAEQASADAALWLQAAWRGAPGMLIMTPLMAVLIAGEELGWRGFALERLLQTRGPVVASLIVGFLWGIWHLPAALDPAMVLNKAPLWYSVPIFTLGTVIFSFVYTWFWMNTRGSLLIACLFHGFYDMLDTFTGMLFPSFYIEFWLYLLGMLLLLLPIWALSKRRRRTVLRSEAATLPQNEVAS